MFNAVLMAVIVAQAPDGLRTHSERSGFTKTGRYEEVERLCVQFEAAYPKKVRCETFGVTPERRPMLALIASADGTLSPEAARAKKRPVVLAQGGIHAGEIDGKDAGFWVLRELLDGTAPKALLENVTFVFIPVFNVDGHERFGKNQRPNQVGPQETGWRVTSTNLNLNRDYAKADAPEMRAMLRLLGAWDPILYLDLHVTNGSKFQHDVAVLLEPQFGGPAALNAIGKDLREAAFKELEAQGHQPLLFYPSLNNENDPSSGFTFGIAPPRFSQGYWSLRNRFGALVETHAWKDYATRVRSTHDVLLAFMKEAAAHGPQWLEAAARADAADRAAINHAVVLRWQSTKVPTQLDFQGYAYTRELSDVSGKQWVKYDESKPTIWRVPYFGEVSPSVTAMPPRGGYVVHAGFAQLVAERLRLHGFTYDVLTVPRIANVEAFRAATVKFSAGSFEGHQMLTLTGEWKKERVSVPAGSLYVPTGQKGRALLVHLLEPHAPDSLGAWGFFNPMFEQKEYLEDYVIEPYARELLAKDPKAKAEFDAKLKSDPDFAKNPDARLRFFATRHPAWDARLNLYPVFRADEPLRTRADQ